MATERRAAGRPRPRAAIRAARQPFSDGRHEAWYDLIAPKGLRAKEAVGITGSVQIWAQTRRSESELKQQDQKSKRAATR